MPSNLPAERNSGDENNPLAVNGSGAAALQATQAAVAMDGFAPPEEQAAGGMNLRRVLSTLFRYKWLILVSTVAGGGLGILATKVQGPVYQAQEIR